MATMPKPAWTKLHVQRGKMSTLSFLTPQVCEQEAQFRQDERDVAGAYRWKTEAAHKES